MSITFLFLNFVFNMIFMNGKVKCSHGEVEFLGEQKGERGVNKYYKCLKCGNILILSEDGILYELPKRTCISLKI